MTKKSGTYRGENHKIRTGYGCQKSCYNKRKWPQSFLISSDLWHGFQRLPIWPRAEDQLLKAWEGLGYYSRVRNMQFAAQTIMEEYDGEMPRDLKSLLALKGLGRIQPERLPVLRLISRNRLLTEMSCGF